MKTFIILIILFTASTCKAIDNWTTTDTILQTAVVSTLTVDWLQTRYTAKHPDMFYETNPIMGKHPSVGTVNTYFAAIALLHTAAVVLLPKEFTVFETKIPLRNILQSVVIAVEVGAIINNVNAGVKLDF